MSVYICLGTPSRGHPEDIEELSAARGSIDRTINSKAQIGDEVFFYLTTPLSSLVTRGRVQSKPGRQEDSNREWFGHFISEIGDLTMLPRPLHIKELQSTFPDWGWLKSPRRSTSIAGEVVPQLLQMAGTPNARNEQLRDVAADAPEAAELPVSDIMVDIESIYTDPVRGPTERETLGAARIGQGQFRQNLDRLWKACAVTGCLELPLLRASHIKPWRGSTDAERLDPYNGLLLVPNLDVAFDRGYISFLDNGSIVISSRLDQTAREIMGIHQNLRLRRVAMKHRFYLEYHCREVFRP